MTHCRNILHLYVYAHQKGGLLEELPVMTNHFRVHCCDINVDRIVEAKMALQNYTLKSVLHLLHWASSWLEARHPWTDFKKFATYGLKSSLCTCFGSITIDANGQLDMFKSS